uniref:Apolipoprotein M n=1 Tax=Cyclopterus lumpus TaxID=8103 RepID=A0A8C2XLP1_CYCLU
MFAVCAVALLCLMSVSHAAPVACEEFLRPLDQLDPRHLEGRWALVAGGFENPAFLKFFKRRNSSSINFSNVSATPSISFTHSAHSGGKCYSRHDSVSLKGSVLTFNMRDRLNLTVTFLDTSCHDCVLMRFDDESTKLQRLYLFSRSREVEMEEFKAQVQCLNMPPPVVMDPNKELCTQQPTGDPAAQTDAKTEGRKA